MAAITRLQHVSVPMPSGAVPEARRFYGEILGLTPVIPPSSLGNERFAWFRIGDTGCEVHCFTSDPFDKGCADAHLCLQVDDLEGFRKQLTRHGVETEETIVITNRPRLFLHDPFGNRIEVTQIDGAYS